MKLVPPLFFDTIVLQILGRNDGWKKNLSPTLWLYFHFRSTSPRGMCTLCAVYLLSWCESCDLDFDLNCRKQTIDISQSRGSDLSEPKNLILFLVVEQQCAAVAFYALTFGLSNEDRDIFIKISRVFKFRRAAARENFSPVVVPHTKAAGSPTSGTQECKMCIGGSKQLVSISKNATKSKNLHAYLFSKSGKNTSKWHFRNTIRRNKEKHFYDFDLPHFWPRLVADWTLITNIASINFLEKSSSSSGNSNARQA